MTCGQNGRMLNRFVLAATVNFENNQYSPNENLRLGHFFRSIVSSRPFSQCDFVEPLQERMLYYLIIVQIAGFLAFRERSFEGSNGEAT